MAYAVLVPERFRGGCPFGVIVVGVEPDELSRAPCWRSQSYPVDRARVLGSTQAAPAVANPVAQLTARACRRRDSSSVAAGVSGSAARSAGRSDKVPSMLRQTPPRAMPNTP